MAQGDSQSLPEQCEQPVTAGASASDSDSDSNSTQSSEPGVEPEDTEPEEFQWGGGLGMATLDQEVNKPLQCKKTISNRAGSRSIPSLSLIRDAVHRSWHLSI